MNPLIHEIRDSINTRFRTNFNKHQFILPAKNLAVLEVLFITYDVTHNATEYTQTALNRYSTLYLRVPMLDIEELWVCDIKAIKKHYDYKFGFFERLQELEVMIFMSLDYPKLAIDTTMVKTPSGNMITEDGIIVPFRTFQQAENINRNLGPTRYVHWLERKKDEKGKDICLRTTRWSTL